MEVTPTLTREQAKPLHVRVAEALGWTNGNAVIHAPDDVNKHGWVQDARGWFGKPPNPTYDADGFKVALGHVPRYDTDWSATGPVIAQRKIALFHEDGYCKTDGCGDYGPGRSCCDESCPCWESEAWYASDVELRVDGPTPLIAVCNLILALKEAGKL